MPTCYKANVTDAEKQVLKSEYVKLALYFSQRLLDPTVQMYADDLAHLPLHTTLRAMQALRRQPGRRTCPLPGDIADAAEPQCGSLDARANDIAGRIAGGIRRYGYTNPDAAEQHIGTVGWLIVERAGGWRHLCNTLQTSQMGTFFAQCRDQIRAQLQLAASGESQPTQLDEAKVARLPSRSHSALTPIADVMSTLAAVGR